MSCSLKYRALTDHWLSQLHKRNDISPFDGWSVQPMIITSDGLVKSDTQVDNDYVIMLCKVFA